MKYLSTLLLLATLLAVACTTPGTEFHVSPAGDDANAGTLEAPLKTIQAAADLAQPGDVITVQEGIYRERIDPPTGGTSDRNRITFQAAEGEQVVIKGSEEIKGWQRVEGDTWKVTIENSFFGDFNPYQDLIAGDWFNGRGRDHHTGAVYLNGHWLTESATLEEVLLPAGESPFWFAESEADPSGTTIIYAQFPAVDPNVELVEINVRQTVFYPSQEGINYLAVKGFVLEHAATPWSPPTAEQIGLVGTHWSKGWLIEENTIRYSTCVGLTLGKHGDEFDNTSANSAEGYVKTIERGTAHGWSKENIGHHIVRNNQISHCEQAGIVGSLGPVFCEVYGNEIHAIHIRRLFTGAEMAGIKFHGAIDTEIRDNHIYNCCRGIWLDWMTQGTRISRNILHHNWPSEDLFVEVNHGPFMVDHNIMLSPTAILVNSQGGAYVHNLIAGRIHVITGEKRLTPHLEEHSTTLAGLAPNKSGDERYFNNILVGAADLGEYDKTTLQNWMDGNVYLEGANPGQVAPYPIHLPDVKAEIELVEKTDGWYLNFMADQSWATSQSRKIITTYEIPPTEVGGLNYLQPNGREYFLDIDFFGNDRNTDRPFPGPFEITESGKQRLLVWK